MSGLSEICHPIGVGVQIAYTVGCQRVLPKPVCGVTAVLIHEATEHVVCQIPTVFLGNQFSPSKVGFRFCVGCPQVWVLASYR